MGNEALLETSDNVRELYMRVATGSVRTELYDGREHLVVPVVALMEGVIQAVNAETPEYVPLTTLQRAAFTWNGRPVVVYHPVANGRQISANSPTILQKSGIGTIFNSRVEGSRMLCEAWLDIDRVKKVGGEKMLEHLRAAGHMEVSVGAFVVTERSAGEFNGKPYKAIWRGTFGDHLAFLPDGRGACSGEMGCGACRAAESHQLSEDGFMIRAATTMRERIKSQLGQLNLDEMSEEELLRRIRELIKEFEAGEPREASSNEGANMERIERIKALMGCSHNPVKDLKALEAASDDTLTALENHCNQAKARAAADAEAKADECTACSGAGKVFGRECEKCGGTGSMKAAAAIKAATDRVSSEAEKAIKAAESKIRQLEKAPTEEEWLKAAPASIRDLIERQRKQDEEKKNSLVDVLKAAQAEYTEEELKAMEVTQLERMSRVLKIESQPVDFSGRELPRPRAAAADDKNDVYRNPPDPYAKALEKIRAASAN